MDSNDRTGRVVADWIFRALLAFLVIFQLFVPPPLSVADNNDFQKLAGRFCLGQYPQTVLFDYTNMHWRFSPKACLAWPFRSSADLAFETATGLNRIFTSPVDFDLRWMGLVYSTLFFVGFVWLQRSLRKVPFATSVAAQAGFLLAVCNAVYIPYFNTFSFDAMTIAAAVPALVGVGLILLGSRVKATTLWLTAASLAIVAASKGQHAFMALVCDAALWLPRGRKVFPPVWARALATALIISGAAVSMATVPRYYGGQATFNTLFYRILPSVPDPAHYLAETRIPPSYIALIGKHSFVPGTPLSTDEGQARFAQWFGPSDLAAFFLRHPNLAWRMLIIHLDEASLDRVRMKTGTLEHRLGNYEMATGKPPQSLSHFFCFWPAVKHSIIARRPRLYLVYILGLVAAAWLLAPRAQGMRALLATVTAMLAVSMLVVMVDGLDSGRHLMIFNFLLDLVAAGVATFAVHRLLSSSRRVPGSPGSVASGIPFSRVGRAE
jgi:hypothetical protein